MVSLLVLAPVTASAWSVISKWTCCGKNPRERVHVRCNSGLGPTFVNVEGKWYLKKKDRPDGEGPSHPSLDAAARAFCKE